MPSAPSSARRIICTKLSANFREATTIQSFPLPSVLKQDEVIMQTHYCGINASDINFTNGKYTPDVQPPFPVGFEAIGEIVAMGEASEKNQLQVGDAVALTSFGAFAEYHVVAAKQLVKIPFLAPSVLALSVCGITASIALEKVGEMTHGETVLVTAAAGATGQFAVQLAKLAGNHVIGTCSSAEKCDYLLSIGCDRAINYKEESVDEVLKKEYPKGVNLVFESVGGEMFDTAVKHLATHGRLIIIGMISGYADGSAWEKHGKGNVSLSAQLLGKSASVRGFFLNNFTAEAKKHIQKLSTFIQKGLLNPGIDPTPFGGLEGIADALDYMYERKNIGKLVVDLTDSDKENSSRL